MKCRDYLNVNQLPQKIKIFERTINLDILEENLHDSIAVYGDSFLTDVFTVSNVNTSSSCILFLCSYAVSLFRHVNGKVNVTYFLFDSYCRNSHGITDGEPGFSALIKFQSLIQIKRYIKEAYQISGRIDPPYIQIQFVSVNVNVDDLAIIQSSQFSYFRRMERQQKQAKENLQETQDRKHKKIPNCKSASQI